jgi:hypothetical protein
MGLGNQIGFAAMALLLNQRVTDLVEIAQNLPLI